MNTPTSLAPYGERNLAAEQAAMAWYGWGSPVGVGLFIISIGAFLLLIHHAGVV